jgi:hypothetical protein
MKTFWARGDGGLAWQGLISWILGAGLGLGIAAAQIVPLGSYLAKSSVWGDRERERPPWWVVAKPRVLDAVCTAVPYVYGSQRRGHPNLARALGVHNLNESAGGFAGLATLIWLAPLAVVTRRRAPGVIFITGLVVFGAMAAFRSPPVDNVLRCLPILNVTDNRRLTLWVAFGLTLLGGFGLDRITETRRLSRGWLALWVAGAVSLALLAWAIPSFESQLRARATAHYRDAALSTAGADSSFYEERANRQVHQVVHFLPTYLATVSLELALLVGLAVFARGSARGRRWLQPALLGLTLCELAVLGLGVNPAISPEIHDYEPAVVTRLRQDLPAGGRAIGVGAELPPNVLARFGLSDARNYDSVELAASLAWFQPLYEPAQTALSSRGEIGWRGVIEARTRLLESGVGAIVASTPPPAGHFHRIERAGGAWIAWQTAKPWVDSEASLTRIEAIRGDGWARILIDAHGPDRLTIRETWDPGWRARLDRKPVEIHPKSSTFLSVDVQPGYHELILNYDPGEVRVGLAISGGSLVLVILVLTGNRLFWIPGITMARGLDGPEPPG